MKRSYLDYDWTQVVNFETGGINYYNRVLKKRLGLEVLLVLLLVSALIWAT